MQQSNRKLMFICLATIASITQIAECSHRPSGESSSDQLASPQVGSGFEYQSLVNDGLVGLTSGQSLGGFNGKRARGKMSAFMPMRGRRTFGQQQQQSSEISGQPEFVTSSGAELQQQQQPPQVQFLPPSSLMLRESGDGDATILRLVASGSEVPRNSWLGAPRQFVSQFALQHDLQQQLQRQRLQQQQLSATGTGSALGPMDAGEGDGGLTSGQVIQAPLMQAKLRRAFHPMRGKKSSLESAIGVEAAGDIEGYQY